MAKRIGGPDWETVSDYMEYVNSLDATMSGEDLKRDNTAKELLGKINDE